MNITENKIDALNFIISISIKSEDYKPIVEKELSEYRKKANLPGFRKGKVPMGVVRRQYEGAIIFDQINKLVGESLNNYIKDNKLFTLGEPIPIEKEEKLDPNAQDFTFDFELGTAPDIELDLSKVKVKKYDIECSEKDVEKTMDRLQHQFGEFIDSSKVVEGGTIEAEVLELDGSEPKEGGINKKITILLDDVKAKDKFLKHKVGDVVEINAKELFIDLHKMQHFFELTHEQAHDFDSDLRFTIVKATKKEKAELNQELFDKVYGKDTVKSIEELKAKIKQEMESYYKKDSDSKFMNDVVEWLLANVKFDLPVNFLKKYIKYKSKDPITDQQVNDEFAKSEKTLRYQLIENKIITDKDIKVEYTEIVDFTKNQMKNQFMMYGYNDISEEEMDKYVANTMKNQEHINQTSNAVLQQKLFEIFLANIKISQEKVSFEELEEIIKKEAETKKV